MKLAGTRPNQIWLHYCTCLLSEIQLLYSWRGACWVITIFKIIFGGKAKPFENSVSYSLKKNWTKISTKLKLHIILSENQWEFWTSSSSKGKREREPNFAFDKWICHEYVFVLVYRSTVDLEYSLHGCPWYTWKYVGSVINVSSTLWRSTCWHRACHATCKN